MDDLFKIHRNWNKLLQFKGTGCLIFRAISNAFIIILVQQIILHRYVTHLHFLKFLHPLSSLLYTLDSLHFVICWTPQYIVMSVVELRKWSTPLTNSNSRSEVDQTIFSLICGYVEYIIKWKLCEIFNGYWRKLLYLKHNNPTNTLHQRNKTQNPDTTHDLKRSGV
jgi:hypothetical protein